MASDYCLNQGVIRNRWITVQASDYDLVAVYDDDSDCGVSIIKRQTDLYEAIEWDLFRYKNFYALCGSSDIRLVSYTQDELKSHQTIVYRNLGYGWRPYYFETVYVKIILNDHQCERYLYFVANEVLHNREFLSLVKFCQCEKCVYYNKFEQLIRFWYRQFTSAGDDAPCLKEGTCDNEILKKTRAVVHTYYPEYITNPLGNLSKRELKKWGKFVGIKPPETRTRFSLPSFLQSPKIGKQTPLLDDVEFTSSSENEIEMSPCEDPTIRHTPT